MEIRLGVVMNVQVEWVRDMIMTEWVVMMEVLMVLISVVPMGMWVVWWREGTLGMWKDISGGYQVD